MWIRRVALLGATLLALSFFSLLAACDDGDISTPTVIPTPEPTLPYNLEAERSQLAHSKHAWERDGPYDYTFEAEASCNCPAPRTPFRITVRVGAIESMTNLNTGEVVTDVPWPFQTIHELFDEIGYYLHRDPPAAYISVAYHPRLRYPVYIGVDRSADMIDDEYRLVITSFKPLDRS